MSKVSNIKSEDNLELKVMITNLTGQVTTLEKRVNELDVKLCNKNKK